MPQPRKYENATARQAAYRKRKLEAQRAREAVAAAEDAVLDRLRLLASRPQLQPTADDDSTEAELIAGPDPRPTLAPERRGLISWDEQMAVRRAHSDATYFPS